ncbi:sigma-54-dependent Fis family transcriptional regulator [Pelotomaculum propionicicum]|uniref:sigma-54-dependent Fis family transcriptional regulator n=1 Tax=Pelotomaculum propionicicum TaxID=258475 RepID=UPI003B81D3E3
MPHEQAGLRNAWKSFVNGDKKDITTVRPVIQKSWERCQLLGVNPYQKKVPKVLGSEALKKLIYKNMDWLKIAFPVVESLYKFVAGSGFVVTVADQNGYLLKVIGETEVVEAIAHGNFIPGSNWSEASAGTNGVGTPLIEGIPLQIFSFEHYCICSHRWTCSAAPIRDPDGRIIGVLDMTGSYEKVHPHTLGMVVAGAEAIERQIKMQRVWQERDIANKFRETLMESISEGILAIDTSHKIIHINSAANLLLGVSQEQSVGKAITDIIDARTDDWREIINGQKFITDMEVNTATPFKDKKLRLTVTSRPIRRDGKCEGVVIVLNEITRARRLAQRMSGSVAKMTFDDMIGKNHDFRDSLKLAKAVAISDSTVLLLGESGTGKDIVAQAIHNSSSRAKGPFVAINCGAIPRDLIGSELFGYTEGAFTGAKKGGSPGKFELADGGTIFLDEIGDMPTELQTNLLRVIENKSISRIGGTSVIPVDVRIIAATNRELEKEIKLGNFRADLYYRLNVVTVCMIPLRERQDDIELLFLYFLEKLGKQMGKDIIRVEDKVWDLLKAYSWPGNIRELQNVVERALHLSVGPILLPEQLPEEIRQPINNIKKGLMPVEDFEKQVIIQLIEEYHGNLSRVADHLNVARTTLYRRMAKYGISK